MQKHEENFTRNWKIEIHNLKNLQLQLQYNNTSEIYFEGCIRFPEQKFPRFEVYFHSLRVRTVRYPPIPSNIPLSNVRVARVSFLFL